MEEASIGFRDPARKGKPLSRKHRQKETFSLIELVDYNATFSADFALGNVGTRSAADVARSFVFALIVREIDSAHVHSYMDKCWDCL